METILRGRKSTVHIAPDGPTVLIARRTNRTVRRRAAGEPMASYIEIARNEALAQVAAGADVINIRVDTPDLDQVTVLPRLLDAVQETVEVPLSIETRHPGALAAALAVCHGKPLVNAVNGSEASLNELLPLVVKHEAVIIGCCMDEEGIPADPYRRLEIATRIVTHAEALGIPGEDVLINCLMQTVEMNSHAALVTLETIRLVRDELGCNMTLDVSGVSSELPNRVALYQAFLPVVVAEGVNAPIVDVARDRQTILALDVLLGRDESATRYIKYYHYIRSGMRSLIDWELVG
ncbi:MAG TPA: dihydropteroate synthase [Anaerolineae bacterium]|nr:dihydropteroate synthase [Anaerolineae bacterium]HQK15485.1 dihydropteroate synthase [Anaerolineae bacterium]